MSLPSGVVTFVFSDIEGSTRLWESDPDGMADSLARHDATAHRVVAERGGFVFNVWKPALEVAGAPDGLRIHDLRHTAAALMIAEGAHPEKIKRHLGHSSITVTMDVYGHLFPADDEALAERLHERRLRALADNTRTKPAHGI